MRQLLSVLACSAALLGGVSACSGDSGATATGDSGAAAEIDRIDSISLLLKQGVEQGQAGEFDEAKATFEKVLVLQEDNKFAWFNLGYLAQSSNATAEAIVYYNKALEIDSSYLPAMYNQAILLEEERPDEAIRIYQNIVEADKGASTAYLRLGLILDKKNDRKGAEEAFKSAVDADASLSAAVPAEYRS